MATVAYLFYFQVIRRKFYGHLPDIPVPEAEVPTIDQSSLHQPVISSVYSIEPRQEFANGQLLDILVPDITLLGVLIHQEMALQGRERDCYMIVPRKGVGTVTLKYLNHFFINTFTSALSQSNEQSFNFWGSSLTDSLTL